MKTAALITHSHPPAATEAVPVAIEAAGAAGWRLVADQGELDKHGAAAEGIELEREDEAPDLCIVLGGDGTILHALRRFASTKSRCSASTSARSGSSPRSSAGMPGRASPAPSPARWRQSSSRRSRWTPVAGPGSGSTT